MSDSPTVPDGFRKLPAKGESFFQVLGDLYGRDQADGTLLLAMRILPQHANRLGIPHGGMLATFADGALGINLNRLRGPEIPIVTVNLSLDYLSSAKVGDWLEAHVTPRKLGKQLAFGDCVLMVGERAVLRATGVFSAVANRKGVDLSDG
ncbi:PaaI family thioesterase [Hydrogenophaga sp. 5NK40-0174]|uniref:PaaI family thioesterase n=1 Tax=Hydrogenophaga sp. 5NK40-0174 TaxID=3127649 RepID=UPI0031041A56